MITRSCVRRQFLLRPEKILNDFILYCLAFAARTFGTRIHAFCFLSNHYHLVVTDVNANLPDFMQWLNYCLARGVKELREHEENVFACGSYSRVELITNEAVLDEMVYTLCNPVKAGLVAEGKQWPGLRSGTLSEGNETFTAEKPSLYFSKKNRRKYPQKVDLTVEMPRQLSGIHAPPDPSFLEQCVRHEEQTIQEERKTEGKKFLGAERVLQQSPDTIPKTERRSGEINPRVASRDKWSRMEWIERTKAFLAAYREALKQFAKGIRDVVFPAGTYWMRIQYQVCCADPDPG